MTDRPHFLYFSHESAPAERRYVLHWLFREVFGMQLTVLAGRPGAQTLKIDGIDGEFRLPDVLFPRLDSHWLSPATLPPATLSVDDGLPILFGVNVGRNKEERFDTPVDVFGSLFFLMSRYEEAVTHCSDDHNRFPSAGSVLAHSGLLTRAIGNEYIEHLWERLKGRWPEIAETRQHREFRVLPSHDIDVPAAMWSGAGDLARSVIHSLVRCRPSNAARSVRTRLSYFQLCRRHDWQQDPNDTIDWIVATSARNGLQSTFFYIPERTSRFDHGMPLEHPHVVDQWKRIHRAGHLIGCHPGYATPDSPKRISNAARVIRERLSQSGIQQTTMGTRQHYLRWTTPNTANACDEAGFHYDSTLGYADRAGFRCGLCYEYPMYDLIDRKQLKLRQRPLVVMDCTIVDDRYMGLGTGERAYVRIKELKDTSRRFNGDFSVLRHNQRFSDDAEKRLYQDVLQA